MYLKYKFRLVLFLLVMGIYSHALALEQEDIQMHGFVSQGYLKSTDNYYFGDSKDGSYEFNEIAVSFAVPVNDDLRFGVQFFSGDFLDHNNNELLVDWAFLDYSFRDWLGFRAGKIRLPFGLYNRQRDADILRTFILLPQSVYDESYRPMVVAVHGCSLYGSQPIGMAGELDYEIFAGTFDTEFDYVKMKHVEGGMLMWMTPIAGLRFSGTFNQSKGDYFADVDDDGVIDYEGDLTTNELSVLSAEFEYEDIKFAAEVHKMRVDIDLQVIDMPVKQKGWYVSASWRILDWIEVGAYYADFDDESFEKDIRNATYSDLDYYSYQKDTTLSARININSWWCVKVESHSIEGVGRITEKIDNMEKNWQLYAVKTSLSF